MNDTDLINFIMNDTELINFMAEHGVQCWPEWDGPMIKNWVVLYHRPFIQIIRHTWRAAMMDLIKKYQEIPPAGKL